MKDDRDDREELQSFPTSALGRGSGDLTDEAEAGPGQVGPLEDGVEDVLSLAVQLVHLIQNQQPGRMRDSE